MADYVADILQRICRLSIEEEDREEPMVSDADHHEDFQVTYTGERGASSDFYPQGEISEGFQPVAAEENLHSFDSVPEVFSIPVALISLTNWLSLQCFQVGGGLRSQGTQDSDDSL